MYLSYTINVSSKLIWVHCTDNLHILIDGVCAPPGVSRPRIVRSLPLSIIGLDWACTTSLVKKDIELNIFILNICLWFAQSIALSIKLYHLTVIALQVEQQGICSYVKYKTVQIHNIKNTGPTIQLSQSSSAWRIPVLLTFLERCSVAISTK